MRLVKVIGLSVGLVCLLARGTWADDPGKPYNPWIDGPGAFTPGLAFERPSAGSAACLP